MISDWSPRGLGRLLGRFFSVTDGVRFGQWLRHAVWGLVDVGPSTF